MKFLSYNVRNAGIPEKRRTEARNAWRFRREAVLRLIRQANPDVLTLQEDTDEQLAFITQGLQGSHRAWHDPAFYDADDAHDAILVRNGIDVSDSGAFWISRDGKTAAKPAGSICTRHATYARLQTTGGPLLVVNVHLDHTEDAAVKREEMELFIGHLAALSGTPPCRTIVTGDFNGVPDLEPYRRMDAFGLRDAGRLKGDEQPTAIHWATQPASERIDYIWLSADLTGMLRDYQVISGAYRRQDGSASHASDHSAVFADLNI